MPGQWDLFQRVARQFSQHASSFGRGIELSHCQVPSKTIRAPSPHRMVALCCLLSFGLNLKSACYDAMVGGTEVGVWRVACFFFVPGKLLRVLV